MKDKIYVVTMYKWGLREDHSYVLGVYNKKHMAIQDAKQEDQDRGGKYIPEVLEFDINKKNEYKIIIELKKSLYIKD